MDVRAFRSTGAPLRATRARRVGAALMWLASAGAAASAVSAIGVVADAGSQAQMVETWRALGYVVFAGLFALLAAHPNDYRGVWELTLFHKAALTLAAVVFAARGGVDGTTQVIVWDGALTVVVAGAYVAARGWRGTPVAPAASSPAAAL